MKKSTEILPRFQPEQLIQIADIIQKKLGLNYSGEKVLDLERRLYGIIDPLTSQNFQKAVHLLLSGQLNRIPNLINELTIPETYFLRNARLFQALKKIIFPKIIELKKYSHQINIWSAGCSSGEEAYSAAILFHELLASQSDWKIKIIASDLNEKILKKARHAVYTEWSFRGTPPDFKEKYFIALKSGRYRLKPEIKKYVTFLQHNLVSDAYSPVAEIKYFDIIFCRNVLIYMSTQTVISILNKFYNVLNNNGYLITGPSEFPTLKSKKYQPVILNETIVYQKAGNGKSQKSAKPKFTHQVKFKPLKKRTTLQSVQNIFTQKNNAPSVELQKTDDVQTRPKRKPVKELTLIRKLANNGRLNEAKELCESYVKHNSLDENGYYLLGTIYFESGDIVKAEENFNRTIYLKPNFVMAHFALANIYSILNHSAKAKKYYKNVLEILKTYDQSESVPESEGLAASHFYEIVNKLIAAN